MCPSDNREHDALLGSTFADRYQIVSRLGKGGMAVVYKATDRNLGRDVALKVLRTDVAPDPVAAKRLIREARAAAQLHHPHIITMHDVGERDGLVYVVMEVLVGKPMSDVMEQEGSVGVERAVAMCEQVASALVAAHAQGIIHRDIKPENLFLINNGGSGDFVKMLDFSIAKLPNKMVTAALTRAGSVFGTPHYMAPEQVEGKQAVPQTDLYALGAVLYELIMGEPPFDGPSVIDILLKHVKQPPPHLEIADQLMPPGLNDLVQELLAKRPQERPESAAIVRERLARILTEIHGEVASGIYASPGAAATSASGATPAIMPPPLPMAPPVPLPVPPPVPLPVPPSLAAGASSVATVVVPPMPAPVRPIVPGPARSSQGADLPDPPVMDLPNAAPPRKFASFGAEDDDSEGRTMVGVGLGAKVQELAKARMASLAQAQALQAAPTSPPPSGMPPAPIAQPLPRMAPAPAPAPPPPPGKRAPGPLTGVEAPSAVQRLPHRPVPPARPPSAMSQTPTHRGGSLAPVPPAPAPPPMPSGRAAVDPALARRPVSHAVASPGADGHATQPEFARSPVPPRAMAAAERRSPTIMIAEAPIAKKSMLLWIGLPLGLLGLAGLAAVIWFVTQ